MGGVAVAFGVGLISSTVSRWLTPTQTVVNGQLQDLSAPKSNYGIVMPQCWGTVGLTGTLIWTTDKIEVTKKKRRGKGGGGVVEENKSYYGNFATLYAYCPNTPAISIDKIYFNGKLTYSIYGDAETLANSNDFANQYMRFYLGSSTQLPDPLLESTTPTATYDYGLPHDPTERATAIASLGLNPNDPYTPPYRNRVYSVCEGLPLAEFGNDFPVIKAVVRFHDNCTLETILTDICSQSGLQPDQYEMIGMDIPVRGFYIDKVMTAADALKILQQAYFFDIIDAGNKVKFISKSSDRPIVNIPLDTLSAHPEGSQTPVAYTRNPEAIKNLPESVEVNYINPELKYQTDNVKARSQVAETKKKESYQLPLILTAEEALNVADRLLHQWFLESETIKFTLPPAYLYLEPGDRVQIENTTWQLTKIRVGADFVMECEGKIFSPATISNLAKTTAIHSGGYNYPVNRIVNQGNSILYVLDIPLIEDKDSDYGVYVTATGGAFWKECSVYASNDNSRYEFAGTLSGKGAIGTLQTAIDENSTSFTVVLDSGELESVSVVDLDAGLNKMLVGDEILQFQNVNLTAVNTYDVGTLRRGIRGTENYQVHSPGEKVILLSGDNAIINRLEGSFADINQTRYFKAVSPGQSLDQVSPTPLTLTGRSLKPYAPVNITSSKDESGNIYLSWQRRDRHAGERTDYENFPLSETSEQWEIDIYNQQSVIRTLASSRNSAIYTNDNQVSDFGLNPTSITVAVYQMSSVVGRGESAIATLTPELASASPTIDNFVPLFGTSGEDITLYGSGLAGVTEARINGVLVDNLVVIDNNQLTFKVPATATTGAITVTTPGGTASSSQLFEVKINFAIPIIKGVVLVTSDRTITDDDFGKLLLVDTSTADVTITLDETALTVPNFTFVVQKIIASFQVNFLGNGSNIIYANSLTGIHESVRFYNFGTSWHGIN